MIEKKWSKNGHWWFVVKAKNGKEMAKSTTHYYTEKSCDDAILRFKKIAAQVAIDDTHRTV